MLIEVKAKVRKPNHPGKILKEMYMKPLNLSVSSLAEHLHISRKTLSKIVNCRGSVTPEMAYRLAKAFNTTPQLWMNLQSNFDLWHVEYELDEWNKVEVLDAVGNNN